MNLEKTSVLLIYTDKTIGMIENAETGTLENFNFDPVFASAGIHPHYLLDTIL